MPGKLFPVVLILLAPGVVFAQTPPRAALEGLDPALLTEGREVPGQESITAAHDRYLCQFAGPDSRARFQKVWRASS